MEIDKFLDLAKKLDGKKKAKKEELEKFQKFFERFHLINRNYLDKETFEQSEKSISSMAETMANTVQYLNGEIAHLRSKRMRLPVENLTLNEMQKAQTRNEMLIKEYLTEHKE